MPDEISVVDSLGLSVLGIVIVFAVLAFLMALLYLMPVVLKAFKGKSAGDVRPAPGGVKSPQAEPSPAAAAQPAETGPEPAPDNQLKPAEEVAAAPESISESALPKNYKILLAGVEYDVETEISAQKAPKTVSAPAPAAAPSGAVPSNPQKGGSAGAGHKKFKIILNGVEYDVDSELDMG